MKKAIINEEVFKHIMDATKGAVDNGKLSSRPDLAYVKLIFESDKITAYSLNGYIASMVQIERKSDSGDDFTCYIRPVPVRVSKQGINNVTIEYDENDCFVSVPSEYGEIRYRFKQSDAEGFPNIEEVYKSAEEHDREVCFTPAYIVNAIRSAASIGHGVCPVIETKGDPCRPVIVSAESTGIKTKQLVLPVRRG